MEKGLKFLGICILLSVIVFSISSVYKTKLTLEHKNSNNDAPKEKYIYSVPGVAGYAVIDKETGTIYYRAGDMFIEYNPITKEYKESK